MEDIYQVNYLWDSSTKQNHSTKGRVAKRWAVTGWLKSHYDRTVSGEVPECIRLPSLPGELQADILDCELFRPSGRVRTNINNILQIIKTLNE